VREGGGRVEGVEREGGSDREERERGRGMEG
jgi:hypothetical protein